MHFHKSSIKSIREVDGHLKYQPNFFKKYYYKLFPGPTFDIFILECELHVT